MPVTRANGDARADALRDRLTQAGEHRRQHSMSGESLAEEIRRLVADAESVGIPTAEVARLLGIDRSTLYRVYRDAA